MKCVSHKWIYIKHSIHDDGDNFEPVSHYSSPQLLCLFHCQVSIWKYSHIRRNVSTNNLNDEKILWNIVIICKSFEKGLQKIKSCSPSSDAALERRRLSRDCIFFNGKFYATLVVEKFINDDMVVKLFFATIITVELKK